MRYSVLLDGKRSARIAVAVNTYNGAERLRWLLSSVERVGFGVDNFALTLLDDGSTRPGQRELITQLGQQYGASVLHHHQNEGITRSWNDVVRHVDSEYSVLLNDDLILAPHWLENLVYFLENNDCGAAAWDTMFFADADVPSLLTGEQVSPRDPMTKSPRPEFAHQSPEIAPAVVMCALGCGFGFKRSVFDALNGFDERTVMHHNESWFGTAAAAHLKLPSYNIPAPRIWHLWSATFRDNPELHAKMGNDQAAYEQHWGGHFSYTHPKFMVGTMPPRTVRWIGPDGVHRERELTIQ